MRFKGGENRWRKNGKKRKGKKRAGKKRKKNDNFTRIVAPSAVFTPTFTNPILTIKKLKFIIFHPNFYSKGVNGEKKWFELLSSMRIDASPNVVVGSAIASVPL